MGEYKIDSSSKWVANNKLLVVCGILGVLLFVLQGSFDLVSIIGGFLFFGGMGYLLTTFVAAILQAKLNRTTLQRPENLTFESLSEYVCSNFRNEKINIEFEKFIEQVDKLMTAEERYYKSTENELNEFCDSFFLNDTEMEKYCLDKHIPMNQE